MLTIRCNSMFIPSWRCCRCWLSNFTFNLISYNFKEKKHFYIIFHNVLKQFDIISIKESVINLHVNSHIRKLFYWAKLPELESMVLITE